MNHHFGNVGDVVKHLVLCELLRGHPTEYVETHAGDPDYALEQLRERAWGVRDLLDDADGDLSSTAYLRLLRGHVHAGRCPGSVGLALGLLEPGTTLYRLWDIDRESWRRIREAFVLRGAGDRLHLSGSDGLGGALTMAPCRGRLTMIDPFHLDAREDGPDSLELATTLWGCGEQVMLWYPRVTEPIAQSNAVEALEHESALSVRAAVRQRADDAGLAGCGVVILGAPRTSLERVHRAVAALSRCWRGVELAAYRYGDPLPL